MTPIHKPTIAVYKFSSCDGCQLSLLNMEDELLELADKIEITHFLEARRQVLPGPYDISLVEGSISTEQEIKKIKDVRRDCQVLIALGTCATSGGLQSLRNFGDVETYKKIVYQHPEVINSLPDSVAIKDYVKVDYELWGCPVNKTQVLEVITALLQDRQPVLPQHSVCLTCKQRGIPCVIVSSDSPCLGPVTRAGCGAICPAVSRGCYGCFGPTPQVEIEAMIPILKSTERYPGEAVNLLRTISGNAPEFRQAAEILLNEEEF
jgi:coenzyme F420-reducing hydrogenase gamma subunit